MSEDSEDGKIIMVDLTSRTPPYDRHLCEALAEQGQDVELWAAGSHSSDFENMSTLRRAGVDLATKAPVSSKTTTKRLKGVEYIVNLLLISIYVLSIRPRVVHVQWFPFLGTIPLLENTFLSICRLRGIPVVYTVHDVLPLDDSNRYINTYRRVYQKVDRLICHTNTARDRLESNFGVEPDSIHIIPHGPLLDGISNLYKEETREQLDLSASDLIVLQFGVIRPYKGVDVLLRAWKTVEKTIPSASLTVAGSCEQSYAESLVDLRRQLGLQSVRMDFRFLPEEELRTLIAAADLLVYPYRNITQSGALFAGMNAGKPIVATQVGGFTETLDNGNTGCLIEPESPESLARAISDLLKSPERRNQLGVRAKQVMEDRFSWKAIAKKTVQCYQSLQ